MKYTNVHTNYLKVSIAEAVKLFSESKFIEIRQISLKVYFQYFPMEKVFSTFTVE